DEIMANGDSLTRRYLSRALTIPVPATRRKGSGHFITIHNPREHNLKGMAVKIPLGTFTSVTGVSGSGKSTLVNDILYRALAQMLHRAQDRPGAHDRVEGAQRIDKVLDMTVREALAFFDAVPVIKSKLATLDDVGLDYIRLGQSATTLSGGEAQRVKLATELSRRATGKTLYILDEPTTGLHFADIQKLLEVLNKLVDQ